MPIETTSTSYLPAEGSVRNHSTHEFIGPTSSVTQIGPKTGASHVGIGRNMMDKDLEKCGNLGTAKLSPCSIPDEWQFKTKDIESLKSIGGGASVTVTGKGGCDAPNTTDNLRLIRISGNDRSGCETIMGDNEKKLNCLINNPGNSYRSNENEKCRDRFKNKIELMEHIKNHSVAHNFDAVAESSIVGVSLEALPSCGYSSSGEPTSSKTLRGLERLETSRKRNDFPKETSGGKGDKKDVRRVSTSFPVEEKSTSQSLSSKSPCTRNLRNRVGARERGRPYSCSVCAKCFTHKGSFDRHVRTHTGERPFPCDACEKSFATKSTLVTHIRTHTGEKPYSCYECKKSFSNRSHLVSHVRTHLGYRPFSCTICEKSFTRSDCLKLHFRTHTGEKPYICKLCGKSFSRRDILVSHMPTHTGKKLYSCRICGKTFAQRGNLSTHIRNHTGQNLYSCNECERSYSNKNHLVTHIRTHTGEKPYSCCECEKSFSSKSNLNTHIRTHAREKPYSCNECENSFTNKSHFVRHVRTHSEKKPSSST
ncbi:zinc finger protein 436-like [Ischnura elegans]|uniref:zinc finger protein 436-like n=1 Tax=Ischnura elegans TaxID=197161 RepID=UPI001ED88368|nr:zinc finger protein 436-like [Ischnura elegans]